MITVQFSQQLTAPVAATVGASLALTYISVRVAAHAALRRISNAYALRARRKRIDARVAQDPNSYCRRRSEHPRSRAAARRRTWNDQRSATAHARW